MKSLDFALLLSKYLTQYLPAQRNLSSNTICSYRDTFKLLLIFCRDIQGFNIAKLPMTQLDRKCIEDFILWLRNIRKSSPSTCNQRLCAIHAFFDYVMVEEPQFMEQCIQIHNIPKMVSSAPPAKLCQSTAGVDGFHCARRRHSAVLAPLVRKLPPAIMALP